MSIFKDIINEITEQYLEEDNNRPWIIAFSGGKDSTLMLQLAWQALQTIPSELRNRKVYVICNNTLVENPSVIKYVDEILEKIQKGAVEQGMPITVDQTTPQLENTFWVNLIGKGYPAPNNMFRWCTERLKISPTTKYITDRISQHGEAVILIGTRSDESISRAKSIKKHEVKGTRLRAHPLPNANSYAPIKDVTTDELWEYLLQVKSPWGGDNRKLIAMYNNASGGDCPLVIDIKTPSCGNSRFGCWVCTVVKRDKSMEAMIDNGDDWLIPLMEIRDFMVSTIDRSDPEKYKEISRKYRMPLRRNKSNGVMNDSNVGPYRPWVRHKILEQVLKAQKIIQETEPEQQLITHQELVAIQVLWNRDFIFKYNISDMYNEIYNKEVSFSNEKIIEEKKILESVCKENPEDFELINNLLQAQKNKVLLVSKTGLQSDIDDLLEEQVDPTFTNVYKEDIIK